MSRAQGDDGSTYVVVRVSPDREERLLRRFPGASMLRDAENPKGKRAKAR